MEGERASRLPVIGMIGAGAVASALAPALAAAGYPVRAVWSRHAERAAALVACLPSCHAVDTPQAVVDQAAVVFLAVPDDAIELVCTALRWTPAHAVVHCSGALGRAPLAAAEAAGAQTGVFHPLQSFAGGSVPLAGVSIAIEAPEPLATTLVQMAQAIGGQPLRLTSADWPRYHVAAVFASNYVVSSVAIAVQLLQHVGLSPDESLARLLPLLRSTVDNLARIGLPDALTGPIARGDQQTLRRHLAVLADEPLAREAYLALAKATIPVAEAQATGQPERLAAVAAVRAFLEAAAREEQADAGDRR